MRNDCHAIVNVYYASQTVCASYPRLDAFLINVNAGICMYVLTQKLGNSLFSITGYVE